MKIDAIVVDRDVRQRRELESISELADSLRRLGLINPVTVERGTNRLIAGERRLAAAKSLGWTEIEVRYFDELSEKDRQIVELEENIKRVELPWEDRVAALVALRKFFSSNSEAAAAIGVSQGYFNQVVQVGEELESGNEQVKAATGLKQAINVTSRARERRVHSELSKIGQPDEEAEEGSEDLQIEGQSSTRPASRDLMCQDFLAWAPAYQGRKFNFIHCDFPYGINHDVSAQGGSKLQESYSDTPELYWSLVDCFLRNYSTFALNVSHVMFWLSMKYWEETRKKFLEAGFWVYQNPLVWLKSDGRGIVSDVTRAPRNVCEYAMMASAGDRRIITPIANAYAAPTQKAQAPHLSEKPVPVLSHFFRMFVDDATELLDPTCGSGNAIRAADGKAQRALGLDISESNIAIARGLLDHDRQLREIGGLLS